LCLENVQVNIGEAIGGACVSLDGFFLTALAVELRRDYAGLWMGRAHQPKPHTLTLQLGETKKKQRLVLSIAPEFPGLHVTTDQFENPATPPHFCLMLRKHIEGSRLDSIFTDDFERVVWLTFSGRDELGEPTVLRIALELTGKHSNVVLIKNGIIIDALKRIPWAPETVRPILPGLQYSPPPAQGKTPPLDITATILQAACVNSQKKVPQVLCDVVNGLSPLLAREFAFRLAHADSFGHNLSFQDCLDLAHMITSFARRCSSEEPKTGYLYLGERPRFHIHELSHLKMDSEKIDGVNNLIQKVSSITLHRNEVEGLRQRLTSAVGVQRSKLIRRQDALEKDIVESRKREPHQRFGQLLYANLSGGRPDGAFVRVIDYFSPELGEVSVPVDPRLSLAENARLYFKRFHRALAMERHSTERLSQCQLEIEYLDTLLSSIQLAEDLATLKGILGELRELGPTPDVPSKTKQSAPISGPLKFASPEGNVVLVGRNNLQNDALVKTAGPKDIWLHVQKAPGSHVLIPHLPRLSDDTLLFAANLAAYYSSQRHSANVLVDYTERRHVKRPPGARPGFVIYEHQQTLVVRAPHLPVPK